MVRYKVTPTPLFPVMSELLLLVAVLFVVSYVLTEH